MEAEDRIKSLEHWRQEVEIREAGTSIEKGYIEKRFDAIDKQFIKWDANFNKVIGLVVGGVVLAIVNFMLRGGFAP